MAYEALYRRYRPGRFGDVTGQAHVMTAMRNAVANGRVGHAYLFSGPRGTGKTTSARILAKALNCTNLTDGEPCDECASCQNFLAGTSYDLRELDAASNNGVEAMRDLISKVGLSAGGHGVFILDEVHMLSTGAENALLKTLEEPPPNVTFILATTEPNKVVPTIRSRTQHYEFTLLPAAELETLVRSVAADAQLPVNDDDVAYVVRAGKGSARDTLSALDQVVAAGGAPQGEDQVDALITAVGARDTGTALVAVNGALQSGHEPELIGRELMAALRNAFLAVMGTDLMHLSEADRTVAVERSQQFGPAAITRALELLGAAVVDMRQAPDPRVDLELAIVRLTRPELDSDPAALLARIERLEQGAPLQSPPAQVQTAQAPPVQAPPAQAASMPDGPPPAAASADAPPPAAEQAPPPREPHEAPTPMAAPPQGMQGAPTQDAPTQGAPTQGAPVQGSPSQGPPDQGGPDQGPPDQGGPDQGMPAQPAPGPSGTRPADLARQTLRSAQQGNPPAAPEPAPEAAPAVGEAGAKRTLGAMRREAGAAAAPPVVAPDGPPANNAAAVAPPPQQFDQAPPQQFDQAPPQQFEQAPPQQDAPPQQFDQAPPQHQAPPQEAPPQQFDQAPPQQQAPPQEAPAQQFDQAPPQQQAPPPQPAAAPAPASGITLEGVRQVWPEVLSALPGRVKSRFSAGEFVESEQGTIQFALPNDVHRQRCEDVRGEVDQALTERLGQPLTMDLVVGGNDGYSGLSEPGFADAPQDAADQLPEDDSIDLNDLTDAPDAGSSMEDRLSQAFPGSEFVEPDKPENS